MHRILALLFLCLTIVSAKEIKWAYTYGIHDFMVDGNSHTLGINTALYASYQSTANTKHLGSFEIFTEYDKNAQDPDHIPIWFRADYDYSTLLLLHDKLKINAISNFDWKMNTVSSVEQYLKLGAGFSFVFEEERIKIAPKLLFGTYYVEIDDDVPKKSGFTRRELSQGFKPAIMYGIEISWDIQKNLSIELELEEWNEKGQWLERNICLSLSYQENQKLYIIASVEKTIYNFDNFSKQGQNILPWNNDTLIKVIAKIPFDW
jgi:hypothetical protein